MKNMFICTCMLTCLHICATSYMYIYMYNAAHSDTLYYDRGLPLCPTSPMLPVLALLHLLASSTVMPWQGD